MKKTFISLSFPLFVLANPFQATLEDEASWLHDEAYVVTASKVKEEINKSSANVTIIDSDMINKIGANTLLDVLRIVPGMGTAQSNIYPDKINVRGIDTWFSEKVLILLDGHSLNSDLLNGGATSTYANFPLEHVKRIEIMRGPASALYGENAFTALINIITQEADEIDGVQIKIKRGSYDTSIANLLIGKRYGDVDMRANLNYRDTDGERAYIASDAVGNSGTTTPFSQRLNADLSLRHTNGLYARANYNTTRDGPRYGAAHALNHEDLSKREAYFAEVGYTAPMGKDTTFHSKIYRDYFSADNLWKIYPDGFLPGFPDGMLAFSGYTNTKSGADLMLTHQGNDYTVVSGISYEIQKLSDPVYRANYHPLSGAPLASLQDFSDPSTNFVSEATRKFWAAYGEILYDVTDTLRLTGGVRYDHYSDFYSVLNPRLGAAWQIDPYNTLKLMYGEAFRAPTFAELYNKNNPALVGNPDLKPEKIKTAELGFYNTSIKNLKASLNLFHSTISDIITTSGATYLNQDKTTTRGVEAELKYDLPRGSYMTANYTYQNPHNQLTSDVLPNIYRHAGYLALNHRLDAYFNLYADAKYIGSQTRSAGDARPPVKSSLTSNATLLAKNWIAEGSEVKLSVYNLFDTQTSNSNFPYDYPLGGRSFMAEIAYKF